MSQLGLIELTAGVGRVAHASRWTTLTVDPVGSFSRMPADLSPIDRHLSSPGPLLYTSTRGHALISPPFCRCIRCVCLRTISHSMIISRGASRTRQQKGMPGCIRLELSPCPLANVNVSIIANVNVSFSLCVCFIHSMIQQSSRCFLHVNKKSCGVIHTWLCLDALALSDLVMPHALFPSTVPLLGTSCDTTR